MGSVLVQRVILYRATLPASIRTMVSARHRNCSMDNREKSSFVSKAKVSKSPVWDEFDRVR